MELRVDRFKYGSKATIGSFFIDGVKFCYTLEDVVRKDGTKVDGATAIPAGTYKVVIDFSNRFQRDMPHVLDVPNFSGIRIHSGNTDADTEGCILLGTEIVNDDLISGSHDAFNAFFPKLNGTINNGEDVSIIVHDA